MRTILGTILVAAAMSASASPLSESHARATPDWFRKGVMYQIQPRAFTPEGTIKAAIRTGDLQEFGIRSAGGDGAIAMERGLRSVASKRRLSS